MGVPQGDSFSPVAFTTTFEMALQLTQSEFPTTPLADIQLGIPTEMQHVNDSDFISTNHSFLEVVLKVLHTELPTYHLPYMQHREYSRCTCMFVCGESEKLKKRKTLSALLHR